MLFRSARHPKEPGTGRGWAALEAGEGLLVAYGEEEDLLRAWGLLEVAARLLRLRARERSVERMQEETLGGALLEGLILGEADPDRARSAASMFLGCRRTTLKYIVEQRAARLIMFCPWH